ncbi:hypothetical protein EGI20_00375 [Aquitalea sp. S1-19]|nr:hypothetical protein [Aquitalea sp. S1-19]
MDRWRAGHAGAGVFAVALLWPSGWRGQYPAGRQGQGLRFRELRMLNRLRDILQSRAVLSLSELSVLMQVPPSALEPMLALWIRKGRVQVSGSACGGGCGGCSSSDCRLYQWRDETVRPVFVLEQA